MKTRENERRDSGIIILLILLLGFICIIFASGWALRFAPSWKLNSNMGSNLNPNIDFLTSRPVGFFEPLDPAILTNPIWQNNFLTPGASFETRIPLLTSTSTPTSLPSKTSTPNPTGSATPTLATVIIPTFTKTNAPTPILTRAFTPTPTRTNTPIIPVPDLQITKSDGVTTYIPGSTLTYIVTVRNNGASPVTGAVVTDNIPTQIANWAWACTSQTGGATGCTAAASSGAGFTDTVNLPNGSSIVYTVTANISAGATGNLINTATVSIPPSDPTPGNNTATDTDTQLQQIDLGITKTDGSATYTAGTAITYTIVVTNAGPSNATGASIADTIPAAITGTTINCVASGTASCGTNATVGNSLSYTGVNIPAGAGNFLTITANGTVAPATTGNLVNTATVTAGAGQTDLTPGNNTATDTDTPNSQTNLAITKTDGSPTYTAGSAITYTIVVSNAGPSNAIGASIADTIPAAITGTTINCVASGTANCGTNGSAGNTLSYTGVNISAGAANFLTITVSGTVAPATTGNLVNTVTVTAGAGQTDPTPGNNSATDTDTPNLQTDLAITKTDGSPTYSAGTAISYTIVVTNAGPSNATGASIADTIPAAITGTTINCVASGTASCGTNGSAGNNLSYTGVNISAGAANFLTLTVSGTVAPATTGNLVNTATVTAGAGQTDPTPGNNTATDTDTPIFSADLQITKTDNAAEYAGGIVVRYTIVVSNAGPSNINGATVTDIFSTNTNIASVSWTCSVTGSATCTASGTGDIVDSVNITAGSSIAYTVTTNISASPTGNLANTASVSVTGATPLGITDPTPGNNSATDTDTLIMTDPLPPQIGTTPDNTPYILPTGGYITLPLNVTVNSHPGYDIVYYEFLTGASMVNMDWIWVDVSDGQNWYRVFNWGNNIDDTNSNISISLLPPIAPPSEPDQRTLAPTYFYPFTATSTGVAIDLDGIVPPGNYLYIRFYAPPGDVDGQIEIDALEILP